MSPVSSPCLPKFTDCYVCSAIEHYKGVVPDIMVMAKGIANGFPLSGIVSRKELMDLQKPGSMGGKAFLRSL